LFGCGWVARYGYRLAVDINRRNKNSKIVSAGSAIVLLINQKDYEHFNKVWREIVRLWRFGFAGLRRGKLVVAEAAIGSTLRLCSGQAGTRTGPQIKTFWDLRYASKS